MILMQYLLIAVTVFSSIVLLILILLQKTKADGLGLAFGSGVGEALFGSRAGNILSKMTIIFAIVFLASTLLLTIVFAGGRGRSLMGQRQGLMSGAMPQQQQRPAPGSGQAQPPPAEQAGGAPTLPGTYLGDQPQSAAPAEAPAPQPAPAPAETPAK
jgi:preprotein translocase subunit SecG